MKCWKIDLWQFSICHVQYILDIIHSRMGILFSVNFGCLQRRIATILHCNVSIWLTVAMCLQQQFLFNVYKYDMKYIRYRRALNLNLQTNNAYWHVLKNSFNCNIIPKSTPTQQPIRFSICLFFVASRNIANMTL